MSLHVAGQRFVWCRSRSRVKRISLPYRGAAQYKTLKSQQNEEVHMAGGLAWCQKVEGCGGTGMMC